MSAEVDTYLSAQSQPFRAALETLRTQLRHLLPDHIECLSYAMPGFREPKPNGKMVAGYAAFTHHIGLYPHSGGIIPHIDCSPFKTSKSGVLFAPETPLPLSLITQIIRARQAEIAAKQL